MLLQKFERPKMISGKLYKLVAPEKQHGELIFYANKCEDVKKVVLPPIYKTDYNITSPKGFFNLKDQSNVLLITIYDAEQLTVNMVSEILLDKNIPHGNLRFTDSEFKIVKCCIFQYENYILSSSQEEFEKCFTIIK